MVINASMKAEVNNILSSTIDLCEEFKVQYREQNNLVDNRNKTDIRQMFIRRRNRDNDTSNNTTNNKCQLMKTIVENNETMTIQRKGN